MRTLLLALLLTGCSTTAPYWTETPNALTPKTMIVHLVPDVDEKCGYPKGYGARGCTLRLDNNGMPYTLSFVKESLSKQDRACAVWHELVKHGLENAEHALYDIRGDCVGGRALK